MLDELNPCPGMSSLLSVHYRYLRHLTRKWRDIGPEGVVIGSYEVEANVIFASDVVKFVEELHTLAEERQRFWSQQGSDPLRRMEYEEFEEYEEAGHEQDAESGV
ncbi:MAG: hypothetical protein NTY19_19000 [Planctomycetota bacterium]|nr:hypothetical protein [Planctomycetota bacterium]